MRNTSGRRIQWSLALAAAVVALGSSARAQQQAQGFAVERLEPSAPGAGFFVMDDLRIDGGLRGAIGLSLGYAHRPLQVSSADGGQSLSVVQHQAFAALALAASYDRFRLHVSFSSPLRVSGQSGTVGAVQFAGPSANLEQNPDTISDVHLAAEARLFGEAAGPLRLGAGAELIFPSGDRCDYLTDDTYRATGRLLIAGEMGNFAWAAHAGVHLRKLDDANIPESPRGSELLFGAAAGARMHVLGQSILAGPEVFGATAFRSLFGAGTTALEALLTGALDGPNLASGRLRIKLGVGAGLHPRFGAPQWRAVLGVEILGGAGR